MNRAVSVLCVGALALTVGGGLLAQQGGMVAPPDKAIFIVLVPADATVSVGGQVSPQKGPERRFITSTPLVPGSAYSYEFVATWKADGKDMKQQKTVTFRAGEVKTVNFMQPATGPEKKIEKKVEKKVEKKEPEKKTLPENVLFFNGKDLTGWEGLPEYWSVKDGAIVGSTVATKGLKFNTFLCSKNKYKDFEMEFQVKMTEGGNSGIQVRSKLLDPKKFVVGGPQCDMGGPYWGSLYGEQFGGMMKAADAKLVQKVLKKTEFNDYYIKCVGKHVTIKLNGATTVDEDFAKMPEDGIIAYQLHAGGPMEVIFRDIRFRDLSK